MKSDVIEIDLDIDLNRIDTKEGILESLKDLASFESLIDARYKAGYEQHLRMQEWYINGIWHFDTCGNLSRANKPFNSPENILSHEEYDDLGVSVIFYMGGSYVAPAHAICNICGYKWTMDNAHDFETIQDNYNFNVIPLGQKELHIGQSLKDIRDKWRKQTFGWRIVTRQIRNNKTGWIEVKDYDHIIQEGDEVIIQDHIYQHRQCHILDRANTEVKLFKKLFDKVGIPCFLKAIPNEYSDAIYYSPWFEARTPWGKIKIGWRKRVINIECDHVNFESIFPNEKVTKDENYIHAWGWDKAEEYLSKIRYPLIMSKGKKNELCSN